MNRTTKHSRRGFTLLEVLATLILIGIILPAVMGGISLATAAAGEAKHKVEAVSLAQTKLSELLATTQYQPT
ncbi:MAG TPA: type II secretion system protein, partial [Tepidisphaeraceae bacterium]|nr:type II secretion system protein [Tepidisphaeraceae bacterium]